MPDTWNLLLRLLLTPSLIGIASLAGRRWGPLVSGWLVGLPFTSGPVTLVLALNHGESFAATAALGTLAGTLSQVGFCLAYAWLAPQRHWLISLGGGCLAFACATLVLERVSVAAIPLFLLTCALLCLALLLLPAPPTPKHATPTTAAARRSLQATGYRSARAGTPAWPWWDLPLRMVLATSAVLALTAVATTLGARLTGLLAPFPLYAAVLAIFAHRTEGATAAIAVLRGLLLGLFAFASFFLALGLLLNHAGTTMAFVIACAVALLVQASALWMSQRPVVAPPGAHGERRVHRNPEGPSQ